MRKSTPAAVDKDEPAATREDCARARPGTISALVEALSLGAAGLAVVAGSVAIGIAYGETHATRPAHLSGACIALEMTAAHGAIDAVRYRKIVRALTSEMNPYRDRFDVSYRQLSEHCADIRRGDAASALSNDDRVARAGRGPE